MYKKLIIAGVVLAILGLGGWATWWWLRHMPGDVAVNSSGGSVPIDVGEKVQPTTKPVEGGAQLGVSQTPRPAASLSIPINPDSPSSTNNPVNPASPDDFMAYEKYKSEATGFYSDLIEGKGDIVSAGKTVAVNYRGWLTNGTVFDESYSRGQPFVFVVGQGQVIQAWDVGLAGMKIGGKRRLIVPPAMGYGNVARGAIPADSVLVFEIELLAVK